VGGGVRRGTTGWLERVDEHKSEYDGEQVAKLLTLASGTMPVPFAGDAVPISQRIADAYSTDGQPPDDHLIRPGEGSPAAPVPVTGANDVVKVLLRSIK
jgi:hypothetical protein